VSRLPVPLTHANAPAARARHDQPMPFADELIEQLEWAGESIAWPRVRALHVPQAASLGSKDGEFCALELDGGALGLSYVLLDDTLAALSGRGSSDALAGRNALDVARWYAREQGVRKTIGFAAANAMTRHLFDLTGFCPADAGDSIGGLAPRRGEHVGMIGLFPPLVKQVTAEGASLTVVELRPELAGAHDGFDVTLDPAALRRCDKVLSTSTVLLNDTLDAVLAHCGHARAFAMIGPGAGCLPDGLFTRGVTCLGGTWVQDAAGFKAALAAGHAWGRFARKTAVTPHTYPGLRTLLNALA
jgi:uncharacterized protein